MVLHAPRAFLYITTSYVCAFFYAVFENAYFSKSRFSKSLLEFVFHMSNNAAVEVRMREDVIEKSRKIFIRKGSKKRSPEPVR